MMSKDILAAELEAMTPVDNEPDTISNFATAWTNYFFESEVAEVSPLEIALLDSSKAAMESAMVGLSQAGPASIGAGIVAFWGVVATSAATIWVTVPPLASAAPPPNLATIPAVIAPIGLANTAAKKSLEDSVAAIAAAIHPINLGGLATNTAVPPVALPIT